VVFNTTFAFAINKKPSFGQKKSPLVLVIARPSCPSEIDVPINGPRKKIKKIKKNKKIKP
jgi:hypothetical protein